MRLTRNRPSSEPLTEGGTLHELPGALPAPRRPASGPHSHVTVTFTAAEACALADYLELLARDPRKPVAARYAIGKVYAAAERAQSPWGSRGN